MEDSQLFTAPRLVTRRLELRGVYLCHQHYTPSLWSDTDGLYFAMNEALPWARCTHRWL